MSGMNLTVTSRIGAMIINLMPHHEILAATSGGRYTAKEVAELESNAHYDPHIDALEKGECICGEIDCPDEYSHWTSGY